MSNTKKIKVTVADEQGTITTIEAEMDPAKVGGLVRYIHSYFDACAEDNDGDDYCTLHQDSFSNCSC